MRYLVIIDNEEVYEHPRREPVVVCETSEAAHIAASALTKEWWDMRDSGRACSDCSAEDLPTLRRLNFDRKHWYNFSARFDVIPIPEWSDHE